MIYLAKPKYYARFYWYVEFVGVMLGCGVVWEIYRRALAHFPGAAQMARNVLLFILLMVLSKALVDTWNGAAWWATTAVELERNLRAVQAAVLIGFLMIAAFYRIPLGQNLWGMLLGYGLLISSSVIILAFRILLGASFQTAWRYLQPLSYLTVLYIWCTTLWSYKIAPLPKAEPKIEQDYQLLAAATRKGLLQARAYLARTMRS
ncbi:MAG TPA: hypothetical protein VNB49_13160 [Candidatus Dormibacteraeota bacterium]|nr:hypothetical protein [Candidatus Dormibacteraeota bacterium]